MAIDAKNIVYKDPEQDGYYKLDKVIEELVDAARDSNKNHAQASQIIKDLISAINSLQNRVKELEFEDIVLKGD